MRVLLLVFVFLGVTAVSVGAASDPPPNADLPQYQFARSYITALGYMKQISDRWEENAPRRMFGNDQKRMILAIINDLSLDSSDLLIIKSYLRKYLTSPNMVIRKAAEIVVVAAAREIALNHEEKTLWEKWYDLRTADQVTRPKEEDFLKTQHRLELQRKEADKGIVQATVLMTKVLVSDKRPQGQKHWLVITAMQRQKLLDKLDSFGGDDLDWGLKPGQTPAEASISVVREILEDSIWLSSDES